MSDPIWIGCDPANHFAGRQGYAVTALSHHVMLGTVGGTAAAFHNPAHGASASYGLGRDGKVYQYLHDEDAPWANGPIRLPDLAAVPWIAEFAANRKSPNLACIAIEWEGTHSPRQWVKVPWGGKQLDTLNTNAIKTWFAPTAVQYAAGLALCQNLVARHHITLDRAHVCRHSDFDSVTKGWCPGVKFPLDRLLTDLQRGATVSNIPPPATTPPPLVWDGVTVPLAVGARLAALGALRLPTCGKVLRAGVWTFAGLGAREVVICEGIVLVALPENAPPWDVADVHLEDALKIKRTLGV